MEASRDAADAGDVHREATADAAFHGRIVELAAMLGDPVGMAAWPAPLTHDESRAWIERNRERYRTDGFGRCAVVWREAGETWWSG